ncbi:cell division control protein 6 homolog B isoform X2 [Diospyros lotus]|uniref:cell division control protein 6 homolog B isoform X2 n=1 Tax=Diospyros lotus TaxID=55363 RepID=UPI00225C0C5F|nr:cell division control protein 6 homolog B isoform X2 [Diospyros lotus]
MPSIPAKGSPVIPTAVGRSGGIRSTGDLTTRKRSPGSNSTAEDGPITSTPPPKRKSPRLCINGNPSGPANGIEKESGDKLAKPSELLVKKLPDNFVAKPKWNPRDMEHLSAAKEALHVSSVPSMVVCREDERRRIFEFCKQCIEQEKAGSLYVCGCPGTGKSLSMERVNQSLLDWAKEAGIQTPDVLAINCTSLTDTSEIFSKILHESQPRRKSNSSPSPLQCLQGLYSRKQQQINMKMTLVIADELDYLITKDKAVLHDLFMITTLPFSKCILIGIANAIDLADRFLPRLQSLNCLPTVVTFRAYSKEQIFMIIQQRLMALPYIVFQPQALELCARKVAAASGDMRKALFICSAIEMLEAELRESMSSLDWSSAEIGYSTEQGTAAHELTKQEIDIVRVDHMAVALSKTYRSQVVETIQSLPQHQQMAQNLEGYTVGCKDYLHGLSLGLLIILCSAVKLFRKGKKDTTLGELGRSYLDLCKSTLIPPVGTLELSSMCRVLGDQGLLKLGQSREDKLRRVTLNVDEADIAFALQGIRVFRNCLK